MEDNSILLLIAAITAPLLTGAVAVLTIIVGRQLRRAQVSEAEAKAKAAEAEGEQTRVETAMLMVAETRQALGEVKATAESTRQRLEAVERRERATNRRIGEHLAWDVLAAQEIRNLGGTMPDPPPLHETSSGSDPGERTRATDYPSPTDPEE